LLSCETCTANRKKAMLAIETFLFCFSMQILFPTFTVQKKNTPTTIEAISFGFQCKFCSQLYKKSRQRWGDLLWTPIQKSNVCNLGDILWFLIQILFPTLHKKPRRRLKLFSLVSISNFLSNYAKTALDFVWLTH